MTLTTNLFNHIKSLPSSIELSFPMCRTSSFNCVQTSSFSLWCFFCPSLCGCTLSYEHTDMITDSSALVLFVFFFFFFFFAVSFHSRHSFKAYALQASCALTVEGILTQMQLNNWFVPVGSNLSYVQYFCVCISKEYVNIIFRVVLPHAGCFVFLSHISSFLMSPFAFNVSCRHGF